MKFPKKGTIKTGTTETKKEREREGRGKNEERRVHSIVNKRI